jgi:Ca2+-binding RTX toxin-like protein
MATPTKWGKEFLVNTHTKGSQGSPTIAGLGDGRFVVVWGDENPGKSEGGLRAQVFNADGSKAGHEFWVNKADGGLGGPTIAVLADGRFVVAWTDGSQTGGDTKATAVRAQIFDRDGSKSGGDFLVNTTTTQAQQEPTITGLADGRFVIAWTDRETQASVGDVRAQVFNGDGSKLGGEFLVNTATEGEEFHHEPTITGLADGRFVVAWTDVGLGEPVAVRAQIFAADGTESGGEFQVNTTAEDGYQPTITGLADGRFVVTWIGDPLSAAGPPTVRAQVFNIDGSKSGEELIVNTTADDWPYTTITGLADGRFVVAWNTTNGPIDVRAQVFDADGTKSGGEFVVNTTHPYPPPYTLTSTITALADGRFVVAWTDWSKTGGDKSGTAVRGQVFDPREAAIDLVGSEHDDQFVGTRFDDILDGADGNDWLFGEAGNDRLGGGNGNDVLEGGKGSDTLEGLIGRDVVEAGNGNDVFAGGEHRDKLKGGGGADQFVFREMGKANADKLVDFKPGNDHLVLDSDIFAGIGSTLGREQFEVGNKPDDTNDRVVYDREKGRLYFDGDGAGGDSQVLFAKVEPGLKLGVGDFVIA